MHYLTVDELDAILDTARISGDEDVRPDYSGRGMYGSTCLGIVLDNDAVSRFWVACGIALDDDIALNLAEAGRVDSMGMQTIIYFPKWTLTKEDNED